jgi:flavin-dependent dehydrogenase
MTAPSGSDGNSYDVAVVGGGPAGSTAATLLTRSGLRVAVFERDVFPRFHVGESLLPANLPLFDRLGCHATLRQAGFMTKPGATFYDDYEGRGCNTFTFQPTPFQPVFAYNVVRATFDDLLLQHAAHTGAAVYRQHLVKRVHIDPDKVTLQVHGPQGESQEVQASLLVDASGRTTLLGANLGKRQPLPDLGKVAIFAHFRGARRDPAIPEGNIRIYIVRDGWVWWIPFADHTESIGCVLHARVAKERGGSVGALFEEVLASSPALVQGLAGAQRFTPVHTAANFSYRVTPLVGERHVAIGDASGFVDPIFSAGVFLAMRSAELAAEAILQTFHRQARRQAYFCAYEARLRRGIAPFLALIQRFYEPAFLDLFFRPHPPQHLFLPVLWVLSGAAFDHRPLWVQSGLRLFFSSIIIRKGIRWLTGQAVESRRHW